MKGKGSRSLTICYTVLQKSARVIYNRIDQTRLSDKLIEQSLALDQVGWGIKFLHGAMIQHNNTIAVQNGIDAMRNCEKY